MSARFLQDRANLLWLEDRDTTARTEIGEARKLGYEIHVRGQPIEIVALLTEELGLDCKPEQLDELRIAFVVDVMITGLFDLSSLGIPYSDTSGGLNGGYVFVDRYLRAKDSPYRQRPVCFLSERELTTDLEGDLDVLRNKADSNGKKHGSVEYIRKFNSAELERFQKFLGTL
jgi:hypothetical protein